MAQAVNSEFVSSEISKVRRGKVKTMSQATTQTQEYDLEEKAEETQKANDLHLHTEATSPNPVSKNQPDPEAMKIFREVSKRHHSLWVSLAKP